MKVFSTTAVTSSLLLLLAQPSLVHIARAATYSISDTIIGQGFYSAFDWQAIADPTHGRVRYVDQNTSKGQNLTYASPSSFVLRTDYKSVLNPGGAGRDSVRIRSKKQYTTHVAVFDVRHMPEGCGTWPAIWEVAEGNWPAGGEVDILEGVNDQPPNAATLHTSSGCTMPASGRLHTGISGQLDCDAAVNGNAGCGVKFPPGIPSYGPAFNDNGGGWFAMERSNSHIKVWFWPRNSGNVPAEIRNNVMGRVNPDSWGTAMAYFPNTQCNLQQYFSAHNIVINLTLCGDWAGNVYAQSGCPSSCVDFVNNNPSAFRNAYFDFGSIRVYT